MSKRIEGWAPELHGGQERPKRKSELTEEDKQRRKVAKNVEKAIHLLWQHGFIKWDESNPREWNAGVLFKCSWSEAGDDWQFSGLTLDMGKVVILPIEPPKEVVN